MFSVSVWVGGAHGKQSRGYQADVHAKGPILLGCNGSATAHGTQASNWRQLPPHKDEDQVRLDVNRSFIYYPKSRSQTTTTFCVEKTNGESR